LPIYAELVAAQEFVFLGLAIVSVGLVAVPFGFVTELAGQVGDVEQQVAGRPVLDCLAGQVGKPIYFEARDRPRTVRLNEARRLFGVAAAAACRFAFCVATAMPLAAALQNSHRNGGRVFLIFVADARNRRLCSSASRKFLPARGCGRASS
jgi:hypothetical protein